MLENTNCHNAIVYVKKESRKEKKKLDVKLSFGKHLEEKHVTWAQFRKKLDKNATLQAGDFHSDAFTKTAQKDQQVTTSTPFVTELFGRFDGLTASGNPRDVVKAIMASGSVPSSSSKSKSEESIGSVNLQLIDNSTFLGTMLK
ncbi:hypothetical protein Tco_0172687 [Tanacetum coccineum]